MKKIISLFLAVCMTAFILVSFSACKTDVEVDETHKGTSESVQSDEFTTKKPAPAVTQKEETIPETTNTTAAETESQGTTAVPENTYKLNDSLMIGDSRTVGLMEYSDLESDFFATVGMSVYNIHKEPVSVPGVGKLTLTSLLANKKYDKIFVMLGINEAGYNYDNTVKKFGELLDFIKEKQPDAKIIIQANLHVTQKRNVQDKYINNKSINYLNEHFSKYADGKNVFYIDANPQFDDANGNMAEANSMDSAHLSAKKSKEWGYWIIQQAEKLP